MKELVAFFGPRIQIDVNDDTSIFCRAYKYSDMERDLIQCRVMNFLETGLMELSHEEYASATVEPMKKDVHNNYTER